MNHYNLHNRFKKNLPQIASIIIYVLINSLKSLSVSDYIQFIYLRLNFSYDIYDFQKQIPKSFSLIETLLL